MIRTMSLLCTSLLITAVGSPAQAVPTARPGPAHAVLQRFVGAWDVTLEVVGSDGTVRHTSARADAALAYGGFWLVEEVAGTFAGAPFRGHGLLGFDPDRRVYVRTWIDSAGPAPHVTEGKFDADGGVLAMHGTGPDLHGRMASLHSVFTWRDRDHGECVMRSFAADGSEARLRIVYARRAPTTPHERIALAVALLVDADYRGDLAELERVAALLPEPGPEDVDADAVRYWRGFAAWRRAANRMNAPDYERDLARADLRAAFELFAAVERGPFFPECASAAAGCLMASMYVDGREHPEFAARAARAARLIDAAVAAAPDNPRVLWIQGGRQMWIPVAAGGGRERALATFEHGLAAARAGAAAVTAATATSAIASLLPSWGEPELLAAMAFAWSNFEPRDLVRAEDLARAALGVRPDWRYAQTTLLPGIVGVRQDR